MNKVTLALAMAAIGTLAFAHTGATGIVKERMDGMSALAQSMKSLVGMSKSGVADAKTIKEISATIQSHSGAALNERFPHGSLPDVSEATPLIWQDWDRFAAISDELFDIAVRLDADARSGTVDLDTYIKDLRATCSDCHEDFRIKK